MLQLYTMGDSVDHSHRIDLSNCRDKCQETHEIFHDCYQNTLKLLPDYYHLFLKVDEKLFTALQMCI